MRMLNAVRIGVGVIVVIALDYGVIRSKKFGQVAFWVEMLVVLAIAVWLLARFVLRLRLGRRGGPPVEPER